MLTLTIKGKWYDKIVSGEKKEEYREIKPYYESRFMNAFGVIMVGKEMLHGENVPEEIRKHWPVPVMFKNGYSAESRKFIAECELSIGTGKPEWGADPGVEYYILHIINVKELQE